MAAAERAVTMAAVPSFVPLTMQLCVHQFKHHPCRSQRLPRTPLALPPAFAMRHSPLLVALVASAALCALLSCASTPVSAAIAPPTMDVVLADGNTTAVNILQYAFVQMQVSACGHTTAQACTRRRTCAESCCWLCFV